MNEYTPLHVQVNDTQCEREEVDCKHQTGHVSSQPVVMAAVGAVSHDREQCRKSKVDMRLRERQEEGEMRKKKEEVEERKDEMKECSHS